MVSGPATARDAYLGQLEHAERSYSAGLRWSPVRLDLGGVMPPDIERGAAKMAVLERRRAHALTDDASSGDVNQ
jgi:hypothetical protein